jgi:hypothetical protein
MKKMKKKKQKKKNKKVRSWLRMRGDERITWPPKNTIEIN